MNIFLTAINAKYIHSNLAVYSLKSYAREFEDHIQIGEYTINNRVDYILEQIYKAKPDVLCFSCYIWNIDYVEELIFEFHKLCPDVPIWLGGPEVSFEVTDFMERHPQVTGIFIGEGERSFTQMCDYYVNHKGTLDEIRGIAYRSVWERQSSGSGKLKEATDGGKPVADIKFTAPQEPLDMSDIPFCYDKIDNFENRIIYYESSRGCPFNCSYCLSSIEKKLRFRDIDLVKKELAFFIEKKVPQVKFVDRTFNCNHEHAMAIWRFIKEHDNGITNFHFEIAADLLRDEELEMIHDMRPGLIQLEIGVQSTNDETIREIHRAMKLEEVKEIVKKIQSGGNIHEHLDLIAGLPYEDYATFARSFDEIYALKPNQLQLGFLKVLKGSYMYEHAREYELVYHARPPYEVMQTKWLGFDDVLRIKQVEEMLEVYYNSGQYEVSMKVLEPFFTSAFAMFQEMGAFYERKGYFGMSHSRIRRCEILLEFLREKWGEDERIHLLEESLTFDLYYRENCKSRPSFAPPVTAFKEQTRYYCKKGVKSHVEPFHYHFPGKETKSLQEAPKRLLTPVYVLFDYEHRDPLDHQAQTMEVAEVAAELSGENRKK